MSCCKAWIFRLGRVGGSGKRHISTVDIVTSGRDRGIARVSGSRATSPRKIERAKKGKKGKKGHLDVVFRRLSSWNLGADPFDALRRRPAISTHTLACQPHVT